jgi:hypothetical protein
MLRLGPGILGFDGESSGGVGSGTAVLLIDLRFWICDFHFGGRGGYLAFKG